MRIINVAIDDDGILTSDDQLLGRYGENISTQVVFDLYAWAVTMPEGTLYDVIYRQRKGATWPVMLSQTPTDGKLTYLVENLCLTLPGDVCFQVTARYGDTVKKTSLLELKVHDALVDGDPPVDPQPSWIETLEALGQAAATAADKALTASAAQPYVGENGNWYTWNLELEAFEDSGVSATGPQGLPGTDGAEGPKGDKGDKGDTGAAGYTPVRGTDYWTAADKAQVLDDVSTSTFVTEKAKKVTGAVAGNFAGLTSGGDLADSGKKPSDFANAVHGHGIAEITGEIGAQNLLNGTDFMKGTTGFSFQSGASRDTARKLSGMPSIKVQKTGLSSDGLNGFYCAGDNLPVAKIGKTYTESVWVYIENYATFEGNSLRAYLMARDASETVLQTAYAELTPTVAHNGKWVRLTISLTVTNANAKALFAHIGIRRNGTAWFAALKLESGNIASDWSPSWLDIYNSSFRKGEEVPSGANLDEYIVPGQYLVMSASIAAAIANIPYTGSGGRLEVKITTAEGSTQATSFLFQEYTPHNFSSGARFIRMLTGGTGWTSWQRMISQAVGADGWQTPTLLNGATHSGYPIRYMKDALGFVHLKGRIATIASDATAFNLPAGYRPANNSYFILAGLTSSVFVRGIVYSTGDVRVSPALADTAFADLSGIMFLAEG